MTGFHRVQATGNTLLRAMRLYCWNRSALAWLRLARHLQLRLCRQPAPRFMSVAPTYRCQCRCVHCYSNASSARQADEMTTEEIKSVIDAAREIGVLEVLFSAGEPLLRDDIVELVRYTHEQGLLSRINTNGLLLDAALVSKLREAGLTQCGVSIDHPDPEAHDRLRGVPGAYRRAVSGIEALVRAGVPCQIQTYTSRPLIPEGLKEIAALGKRLGVMNVYFFFPVAVGRWDGSFEEVLTDDERASVRSLQDPTFVHVELPAPETPCCLFTKSILYVSPRGEVTPCPFVPYALGNIREHPLPDIWRRHCAALDFEMRGACPMNFPGHRETLKNHVASVRHALGGARAE